MMRYFTRTILQFQFAEKLCEVTALAELDIIEHIKLVYTLFCPDCGSRGASAPV